MSIVCQKPTKSLKSSYGDQHLSQMQVFQWHKDLLEGQEKVEDELCAEGPVTAVTSEDMDSVQDLMVDSGTDGR